MGFGLGSIFGGGSKSKVTQSVTTNTKVDVSVNISSLSEVLEFIGKSFTTVGEKTNDVMEKTNNILASLSDGQKIEAFALIADVQNRIVQNQMLNSFLETTKKYLKHALIAGVVLYFWKKMK
jgi:hypothetical protein